MKTRLLSACVLALTLVFPAISRADDPDVKEILQAADDATKEVKGVAYEAEFFGEGSQADDLPHIKGKVKMKKPKSSVLGDILRGAGSPPMRAEGTMKRGNSEEMSFKVATDGKLAYSIDDEHKTITKGEISDAGRLLRSGGALLMREFAHPTPFSDELRGESKHEGIKKIGDQDCDVIYVTYSGGQGEARWYFSKEDHLPRRVDRISKRGDDVGSSVTVVTNLEVDPEFAKGTFRLKTPEGYKEKDFEGAEQQEEEAPRLLAAGKPAPDFELQTADGKTVSLKELRGSVVVLDFWATWCGPCRIAMPGVQKLHEQFKDKPVKVFGVSCWEKPGGDPAKFMKDKKYTYGLLIKGDNVADKYKVTGIPTFYIIDTEGKIAHAATFKPGHEKELAEVIKKAMKNTDM